MMAFDLNGEAGKKMMDSGLASFAAMTKGMQSIASEASEYMRSSFEQGADVAQKMAGAGSVDKAMSVQADYAKSAYESFVTQATRMTQLYSGMASDVYKPFETAAVKTR